jgi:hypothetical protein
MSKGVQVRLRLRPVERSHLWKSPAGTGSYSTEVGRKTVRTDEGLVV